MVLLKKLQAKNAVENQRQIKLKCNKTANQTFALWFGCKKQLQAKKFIDLQNKSKMFAQYLAKISCKAKSVYG